MKGPHAPAPLVHAATRFTPPRLRPEFVLRTALVDRVLTPGGRLVVVSGPAGSGKSTLLAQAYEERPNAVWLSMEPADDDPAVLWSALIDSTAGTIPGFGDRYRHRLDAPGSLDSILPLFVNEVAEMSRPVRFVLDDLQLISDERSIDTILQLVRKLPDSACIVTASRSASPFPLGRLRVERAVIEIGAADLAMDIGEAKTALSVAGIDADDDQIAALVRRTEGWVAGLAWATLALQTSPDSRSFLETVNGVDGELSEYLIEEVLAQHAPELRSFMKQTSLLTQFNAALCDEVCDRDDSRAVLDELDRTNSFLVPLDRQGEWFRYHHLVHDVLEAQLHRESPDAVPALHRRASSWLSSHGQVAASVHHARAAREHERAADIVCANWWTMMNTGRIETAYALFEEFGSSEICRYQPLAISAALLYGLAGDHQNAQLYARAAERGHFEGAPPDGSASIESALALMRGSLGFDGVDAILASGRQALELESEDSPWRLLATFLVVLGHIWRDELDEAEPLAEDVVAASRLDTALAVYGSAELALIRLARGDIENARAAADTACAVAAEAGLDTILVTAIAHGAAAKVMVTLGDFHAAERHLDATRAAMEAIKTAMPMDAMHTRILLADVALQLGRTAEAREYIEGAVGAESRYSDTGVMGRQLDDVRARLGDVGEQARVILSERELAVLEQLTTDLSIQGIADTLFVSKETVKTHRRNIYRKLSAASREDAVLAGRRAGLIQRGR